MKTLRLWLLVLLAVLLPIRGAVAGAMLCPPMGSVGAMQMAVADHHPAAAEPLAADAHDPGHMQHDHMQHDHGQGGHHEHQKSSAAPDACNLCAALCSVTPMLSSLPKVDVPQKVSTVTFPELAAPAPTFVSGGQDRPPRTI